jgi:hypothetical protein
MEAKELRIDNWIKYNFKMQGWKYVQVCANDFHNGFRDDKFVSINYKPIPLTEEWLVKFGFVKDKKHNNCCDLELENDFYLQGVGYGKSNIKYEVILTDSNDNELTLVKHVHQLQNLYFALTNEELIIK